MTTVDDIGAFVPHGLIERAPTGEGPLEGLTFALKDLFDVAGVPTGAGNPDWLATHPVPTATAPVVQTLLGAGARLVGKTLTDEIAWSLTGENAHYGTPHNTAAPGRIPGGSSSGSASAVAAGLADFAIGSDTGGSIRLPASLCGLIGLRPTHGRVPIDGAVALAPSYDTVGWFARDAAVFEAVARVLLPGWAEPAAPGRLLIADDMFERAVPETRAALAPALEAAGRLFGEVGHMTIADADAADWRETFRVIQSAEAWAIHGDWVTRARPAFGPGVRERFSAAPTITAAELAAATEARARIRRRIETLIPPGVVVALPTVPGIAPRVGTPEADLAQFRAAAIEMLCVAGHAGLPQISLPVARVEGCPVGLSLMAARGGDEALVALAGLLLAA